MLKKSINYVDYNGVERTEVAYFNLTQAEITEMEYGESLGFTDLVRSISETQDIPSIIKLMKDLITRSYGIKSPDGRRHIKNKEVLDDFTQTGAYSKLFMELAGDVDQAIDFINGIMPDEMKEEIQKQMKEEQKIVNLPDTTNK